MADPFWLISPPNQAGFYDSLPPCPRPMSFHRSSFLPRGIFFPPFFKTTSFLDFYSPPPSQIVFKTIPTEKLSPISRLALRWLLDKLSWVHSSPIPCQTPLWGVFSSPLVLPPTHYPHHFPTTPPPFGLFFSKEAPFLCALSGLSGRPQR